MFEMSPLHFTRTILNEGENKQTRLSDMTLSLYLFTLIHKYHNSVKKLNKSLGSIFEINLLSLIDNCDHKNTALIVYKS